MKQKLILITFVALLFPLSACEPKPQEINYGGDQCEYCRMMITEPEFGSQALNHQGRSYKFDSVECMTAFNITTEEPENIHSLWVPNFLNRDEWLQASSAVYLHSETLRSPMGLFLSAYSNDESAQSMKQEYGGRIVSYDQVRKIVKDAWLSGNDGQLMSQ